MCFFISTRKADHRQRQFFFGIRALKTMGRKFFSVCFIIGLSALSRSTIKCSDNNYRVLAGYFRCRCASFFQHFFFLKSTTNHSRNVSISRFKGSHVVILFMSLWQPQIRLSVFQSIGTNKADCQGLWRYFRKK